MEDRIRNASKILSDNGIKPSHQRIQIYLFLSSNFIHPTAEQVYDALKDDLPTLSKSTVYSTLKTFLSAGLIRDITIEDNEVRYEFNLHDHGHFKCEKCGEIFDFKVSPDIHLSELEGFSIRDINVFIKGICKNCINK